MRFDGDVLSKARLPDLAARGVFFLPDHDLFSNAIPVKVQLEWFRRQFHGGIVSEALDAVGLVDLGDEKAHALSGGELRRAELAAVIIRRPRCLLADEPLRGIAPRDAEDIGRLFRSLAENGAAVVVSGHEVPVLMAFATHVTWCTAGTTHELGPPDTAAKNDAFRREYLGENALRGQAPW